MEYVIGVVFLVFFIGTVKFVSHTVRSLPNELYQMYLESLALRNY
jgi:hypothetical protein